LAFFPKRKTLLNRLICSMYFWVIVLQLVCHWKAAFAKVYQCVIRGL
jgi:hypothetical protein